MSVAVLAGVQFFGTIQPMAITKNVIIEENPPNPAYIVLRETRFQISQNTLEMNDTFHTQRDLEERASIEENNRN